MSASARRLGLVWVLSTLVTAISTAALTDAYKAVVVVTDATSRVILTWRATVDEVLTDAGVRLGPHDRVRPPRATPVASGTTLRVRRAVPVTVAVGRTQYRVLSAAETVDELLAERPGGLVVRPGDRVFPARDVALVPGALVRVVRIETRIVEEVERVRPGRVLRPDDGLPRGLMRVVQPGRPGLRLRRVAVTLADGVVIGRRDVGHVLVQPPHARIVHVGTRRMVASRGEFAGKEILHMEATGYAPWTGWGVDDVTATGMRAGYGVVAVDPRVIPLGARLYIEGYGVAIAGDTGGAIKGHRIDLGFNTAREAIRFGRRPVRVYILSTPAPSRASR
ncbi:MAG: 3D domain-containing protein [Armatimonadota bacterium]|nr:3D domain-containing protein [Armatimonadota bacterium]MDR7533208.1 3D domain-containing protein [Armatimonadota bacterium]MDR7535404.1 3D domain-containing protein [Armatimonadota bacterium]